MSDTRDTLFLRLAVRQGVFSKEEAEKLLAYYRETAETREGIGHFLVREGYMEEDTADTFRNAIAHRAEGHVADNRPKAGRRKLNKSGRGTGGHHRVHHHVNAQPSRVKANPAQLVFIAVGMIVLVVVVIMLASQMMNDGSNPVTDSMAAGEKERREAKEKAREDERRAAQARAAAEAKPVPASFSESEIRAFKTRADRASTYAYEAQLVKGEAAAISIVDKAMESLSGELAPQEILKKLEGVRKELIEIRDEKYAEYLEELKDAKSKSDNDAIADVRDKIKNQLGDQLLTQAEKAAGL